MKTTAFKPAFPSWSLPKSVAWCLVLLASSYPLVAEEDADIFVLDEMMVMAAADDLFEILPTRTSSSTYGTSRFLEDTPRSVTLIESATSELFGIQTVNDFVAVTPGSFTGNYFGVPGSLDVRGERADNFFRGFRRIENRGNFPTNISSTDYVEILRGPPPPIYGGGKVGGILNYIPKTARSNTAKYIEEPIGVTKVTVGTYGKLLGSIEYGLPFEMGGKQSGAYFFVQAEDSDHYYNDIYNESFLFQAAFDTELSDAITLEYGLMIQLADLNQSLGWNRVTQDLIDSEGGLYLSGQSGLFLDSSGDGFLQPAEISDYALEQFAFASPFPYGALSDNQKAAFALDPSTVKYTKISHHEVQVEPIDFSKSDVYTAYFDVTVAMDNGMTFKNQSFYDDMDHTKYSSYGFTADYDAYAFENKSTLLWQNEFENNFVLNNMVGLSYRYSDGEERESRGRGYQVLDRRDISMPATPNDRFEGAHTGTGAVPYNWVQIGDFSDLGLFGLIDGSGSGPLGFILSARYDEYDAETYGTDTSGVYGTAKDTESAFTYNGSVIFNFNKDVNAYVTYAESTYLELGQGGMIARTNIGDGIWTQDSKLTEIGLKGTLAERRLFASAAYYEQEKTSFNNLSGSFDFYESEGVELEMRYAPTKTISIIGTATFQETRILNTPFFLGIPPATLGLDPALVYGGRFVGLGGILGIESPIISPTPEEVISLNATYTSPAGWGISLGGTYVSSFYSGYAQEILLPSYLLTRGALFYNTGDWSFRLNANNMFDEKYYNPQFLFWDVFISPSVGPTFELTTTYNW
jgi:iron complex outermembrane recepter protein